MTATSETPGTAVPAHVQPLHDAHAMAHLLRQRLKAAIFGRDDVIDLVLVALLADGHVLLEDYPGSGKTTLARALGEALEDAAEGAGIAPFRRIQFTPDLLPSDITGTSIFDVNAGSFAFKRGPVFAHVVLADEINRTSPKVQSALLEAMAEKQVTVDDTSHGLDALFFVIATQNPLDLAGTYPLPSPQLDRFLFKITMAHVPREAELALLDRYPVTSLDRASAMPGVSRAQILAARQALRAGVAIAPVLREALVDLAGTLRADPRVLQGASTRSLLLALPALQARALLHGRDYVGPEDLDALAAPIFRHRLVLAAGTDDPAQVVRDALGPQLERLARESLRR
ncbi:MAG: AAA family ATPase [Myxococcota bacterium]